MATDLLEDLSNEVYRQAQSAADYVQSTEKVRLSLSYGHLRLHIQDEWGQELPELDGGLGITARGHQTIAENLGVPKAFYDRLLANHPDLLLHNANALFEREPKRHLFRAMDGNMRAMLSDRYRRIDNWDIMKTAIPILRSRPDLRIHSCKLTETNLYLKALFPRTQLEVSVGEPVQAGVLIKNSEVGVGAASVYPFMLVLVCNNGMVATEYGKRRNHVGRQIEDTPEARLIYSEETLRLDDQALLAKFGDTVRAAMDESVFASIISQCKELAEFRIEVPPVQAVERLRKRVQLTETETESVRDNLVESGDMTGWGLLNALTATAREAQDYARGTELEAEAGKLLEASDREILALVA